MRKLLIRNGVLWSAGGLIPGGSIAIIEGRIAALGSEDHVRAVLDGESEVIDALGGLITPSFADAHVHPVAGGVESNRCDLSGARTADECFSRIRSYARSHNGPWILGGGWDLTLFDGGLPTRHHLDAIVSDRPILLFNADHHGAWANSRALSLAGLDAASADPVDGRIEREPNGHPSGMLHEGAADLVLQRVDTATPSELKAGLISGVTLLHEHGITAWQDALVGEFWGNPDASDIYAAGLLNGSIRGRASGALWIPRDLSPGDVDSLVDEFVLRREANGEVGFVTTTAKMMLDGIVENHTAAMSQPYLTQDGGTNRGLSYFDPGLVALLTRKLNMAGFAIHFHAIGDRAVSDALDAVATVPMSVRSTVRNHIAHVQVVNPADLSRFAELGVTMNAQALWACNEAQMIELTLPVLGEERARWQYPFGSALRHGVPLAMGSDWPVSTCDPWQAIHVAVTRRAGGATAAESLNPSEALTLDQALTAYTRGSHDLLELHDSGRLHVGANADIAIADRNPFALAADDIHLTSNRVTVLAGDVLWSTP